MSLNEASDICDFAEGCFFCVLPAGHPGEHGGYNDDHCPWGQFRCRCVSDPVLTEQLDRFLHIEAPRHTVEDFIEGRQIRAAT